MSIGCYNQLIKPYILYMEDVLTKLNNRPVMIGMDSKAVSPLWFSKNRRPNGESIERDILNEINQKYEQGGKNSKKVQNNSEVLSNAKCKPVAQCTEFPLLPTIKKSTYAVVLSSDDPKKTVHPATGNARVNSIVPMSNGAIKVLLQSKDERDSVQRMANTSNGLKAKSIDRFGPRVMAYSIYFEVQNKEQLSHLYIHEFKEIKTEEEFKKSIKILRREVLQRRNT